MAKKPNWATKRQIRERRKAKRRRQEMYLSLADPVDRSNFAEVEQRVLAVMHQNQGFKTGQDLYGGHPPGSPERNAVKARHYLELYGMRSNNTFESITGRTIKKT